MSEKKLTNEELVEKATIVTSDIASAGKLNPEQSDKFLDYVMDETVLKGNVREVRFRNEFKHLDKIGVGARAALPKAEATDPSTRRGVSHSKVILSPKEIMVPFEISDVYIDWNLEHTGVEDTILKMFAKQLSNDMEDLAINGDDLGPAVIEDDILPGGSSTKYIKDGYLALGDGWLEEAESGNVLDAGGKNIGLSVFSQAIRSLPTKFRRDKSKLRWIMSPDLWEVYLEKLATRASGLGDAAASGATHGPLGIKAVPVPLFAFEPTVVDHVICVDDSTAAQLSNVNVSDVVVTVSTLGSTATSKLVLTTDYTLNAALGQITKVGSTIADGATVKVTYSAKPQFLLTHMDNLIWAVGRDLRFESDRNIFKGVNEYALTVKMDVAFEEVSAVVKVKNLGTGV